MIFPCPFQEFQSDFLSHIVSSVIFIGFSYSQLVQCHVLIETKSLSCTFSKVILHNVIPRKGTHVLSLPTNPTMIINKLPPNRFQQTRFIRTSANFSPFLLFLHHEKPNFLCNICKFVILYSYFCKVSNKSKNEARNIIHNTQ